MEKPQVRDPKFQNYHIPSTKIANTISRLCHNVLGIANFSEFLPHRLLPLYISISFYRDMVSGNKF